MEIIEIIPSGCVLYVGGYIETGDLESAQALLSPEDLPRVQTAWTEDVITARKLQREQLESAACMDSIIGNPDEIESAQP